MIRTEAELRQQVAHQLRRDVPEASWRYLVEKFYVEETLDGEKTVTELAQDVRELLAAAGQRTPRRRGPRTMRREPAETGTTLRQAILSEVVAFRAQNDPVVTDFRERFYREA